MFEKLKYFFIKKIYADHNDSRSVKTALKEVIAKLPGNFIGLNIGSGKTKFDPRIKNMEIDAADGIDYVGSVENIPCGNESFDLVITQEVLEHVQSPSKAIQEIHRVLKKGGVAYIQLPFIIGFHPCPNDYWRFTHQGIAELVERENFEITKLGKSVGPAVGFYRIVVEFLAIIVSVISVWLYRPAKLIFSLVLYPIKWLDPILLLSREADRVSGGYFVVCRKV